MPLLRPGWVFILLLSLALPARALGPEGHQIIAGLAARQLSPAARDEIQRLLAGEADPTLAGVAYWADDLRDNNPEVAKRTARWHYVNFPRGDCSYSPPRDCPDGNCVIAAINHNFLALADRHRSDDERRQALKFLVHFVGDVHQPLHAGYADDRGGNDFQVSYRGTGSNLHRVWDSLLITSRGLAARDYADILSKQPALPVDPTRSSDRPAVDWAVESCRLVQSDKLYPASHVIDDEYLRTHRGLVELRLRQAGARLADMLNFDLGQSPVAK